MGLQFIKENINIDFVGKRRYAYVLSGLLILISLASLVYKGGPEYGIDFAGGLNILIKFDKSIDLDAFKAKLAPLNLPGLQVQRFGDESDNEFMLRVSSAEFSSESARELLNTGIGQDFNGVKYVIQSLEMVGPKVGADLRAKALDALFYVVLLISIYISGRFEQRWWTAGFMALVLSSAMYFMNMFVSAALLPVAAIIITLLLSWRLRLNYALGAVIALIHDVFITVGVFSLLNKEIDLNVVAALLTVLGYSLNDTIIVFDRIRENIHAKHFRTLAETINRSVNQTLSRTVLTSGVTLLSVLALYLFGGGVINDFAFALLVGIVVGTYSSIFVASPIVLAFSSRQEAEQKA